MAKRFLENKRRPVADYDHIVFDENEVAALRAKLDLDTPLRVHWNWDYVTEIESLRKLYERGKVMQWDVEKDIDWSLELSTTENLMPIADSPMAGILQLLGRDDETVRRCIRDELEWSISQVLHGEQAALQLCAQLVNSVPQMDAKLFAGQQVVDECRHVEMFAKLLARKFGTVHPISPNIKYLLDEMVSADDWHKKTIGMQILFEGVAMAIITDIGKRTTSDLVRQTMRMVARDEARHAAFGVLTLRDELSQLDPIERDGLEEWTWMVLEVVANGLMSSLFDEVGPKYGLAPELLGKAVFSTREFWDYRYHLFNHTVMPNLKRLGIITDLTRRNYDTFRLLEDRAPFGTEMLPDHILFDA